MKETLLRVAKNPLTYAIALLIWILFSLGKLEGRLDTLDSSLGYIGKDAEDAAESASSCSGIGWKIDDIKDDVYYLKNRRCY